MNLDLKELEAKKEAKSEGALEVQRAADGMAKRTPNAVCSKQQAALINAVLASAPRSGKRKERGKEV
ncbi:MAG TPA: hypothetical protein ENN68_00860 [Methanomicrobia archaeon]|nr:hypothetical protein [Methanomicrobia archaeon]